MFVVTVSVILCWLCFSDNRSQYSVRCHLHTAPPSAKCIQRHKIVWYIRTSFELVGRTQSVRVGQEQSPKTDCEYGIPMTGIGTETFVINSIHVSCMWYVWSVLSEWAWFNVSINTV